MLKIEYYSEVHRWEIKENRHFLGRTSISVVYISIGESSGRLLSVHYQFVTFVIMTHHRIISSPLQGFTDYRFRNALHKYFGGVDIFYAPYIRLNGRMIIKPGYQKDLQIKNNNTLNVIPQVMTNSAEEFLFVAGYVQSLGYKELNWNLGCPYPMVTNKCLGSGLISDPSRIDAILDQVHSKSDIIVSMKMRMGYDVATEILDVFPVLAKYPIKNIGIHARIGKQLYVGGVDLDAFRRCVESTDQKLYFNGDITSVARFREMAELFPMIDHWMIGRGLIADPFLPSMIKEDKLEYPENRIEKFSKFHDRLFTEYSEKLTGDKAIIRKMLSYWEYFAQRFDQTERIIKKIKKTKSIEAYDQVIYDIFQEQGTSAIYS